MTYSFTPLADIPVDHTGFFLVCFVFVVALCICLMNEPEAFFVWFFFATVGCGIAYCVSYVWTDQTPKTFANTQVIGTFVGYESEGYKERSGKSYVDRHFTYIIYKVPEGNVMLPCVVGKTYPERAILYKN